MRTKNLLAAAALTVLVACGDDDDSAGESAEALCGNMVDLASTVASIAGADVDPNATTIDDVSNALGELESQIDDVQDADSDLTDAVRSDLRDAYEGYVDAIAEIDGDSTLAEAGATVEAARVEFREAWDTTLAELDCRPSTT